MSIGQLNTDGLDRLAVAIERLRAHEPSEGYYLAFSGGKDSQVIYHLAIEAGVKFDAHYNVTTVDPPELVYFIREHYPEVIFTHPRYTMWELIERKGLPTRQARFCCAELKERSGAGRIVVTGIRWAESRQRAKRLMVEVNPRTRIMSVNPIIDWSDDEVWEFLNGRELAHCSLYDEGFKRLGCVMCPLQTVGQMTRDAERWPKIAAAYKRAAFRSWTRKKAKGQLVKYDSPEEFWSWWWREQPYDENECLFGQMI